jgi:hypothetical protein
VALAREPVYPLSMRPGTPQLLDPAQLEAEKSRVRDEDLRALAAGQKTPQELAVENMPFRLNGERIEYAMSTSDLW